MPKAKTQSDSMYRLLNSLVIFLLTVFVSAAWAAEGGTGDCDMGGNMSQMRACAGTRLTKADQELNRSYKQLITRLSEKNRRRLRDSQRAWLSYRDKACNYEVGPSTEGGTLWSMEEALCEEKLTKQRNEILRGYVACTQNGCPE